jgi:xanthine phosphoribosyltransferase
MTSRKVYYGYDTFLADTKQLTKKIEWEFDAIIAIARGGLSLAQLLGEYYELRSVYSINTIGYDDTQKLDSVKVFNIPQLQDARSVLIVDDIVDSGDTLIEVLKVLGEVYPSVTFKTASLFYQKSAKIAPNWYVKESTEWIDFYWTVDMQKNDNTTGIN